LRIRNRSYPSPEHTIYKEVSVMNRKLSFRIISLILLLVLLGTGASAATLPSLLKYAKSQGFTVKVKSSAVTKATLEYAEYAKKKDTLTWTDGKKKSYVITAPVTSEKAKLLDLYVYMLSKYTKWKACSFKVDKVIIYGYNIKKAKTVYKTLASYRKVVKKHVVEFKGSHTYVLNTSTKKFHYPGCNDVGKMNPENKEVVTADRNEIIRAGYSPCGHCNP